jgi:hypothetical protein
MRVHDALETVFTLRRNMQDTVERIQGLLASKNGLIVESFLLEASNRMSVAQYQTFHSWGFEDLSLEADETLPP